MGFGSIGFAGSATSNQIQEKAEGSTNTIIDDTYANPAAGDIIFSDQVSLPNTDKFYKISAVEWKNTANLAGRAIGGVAIVDDFPPSSPNMLIVAQTPLTAHVGANQVQKVAVSHSMILAGGTKIVGFVAVDALSEFRSKFVAARNALKATGVAPTDKVRPFDTTAWSAIPHSLYLKIYYLPYGPP